MSAKDPKKAPAPGQTDAQEINALVAAVKANDPNAFPALHDRYLPLIESSINRFINLKILSKSDREDVRQEASICLYRAALTFKTDQQNVTFGLYAKTCLRNCLITCARHAAREKRKTSGVVPASAAAPAAPSAPENYQTIRDTADRLLSKKERTIFYLFYFSGLSYDAIAAKCGISVKSVDNALARARRKIRSDLRENPRFIRQNADK